MKTWLKMFAVLAWCVVTHQASAQTLAAANLSPQSYSGLGVVQQVFADLRQVTIHHQAIPDFMPEMTMDFKVKDTNALNGLRPGSHISFDLRILRNDAWIENIRVLGYAAPSLSLSASPVVKSAPELKAGDHWPDVELLTEDGRRIHFSDFHGQTVALSFFFTRCPLPDFCPRMNNNFAEARNLLPLATKVRTNFVFLSISFDADFDTPDRLAAYARNYRDGDTVPWLFTAATPDTLARLPRRLGLSVRHQGESISHNLRTVVLDPQGRVYRQFDGNDWTPKDLASAMQEANEPRNQKLPP